MAKSLAELHERLKACRNCSNPGCRTLVEYRERCNAAGTTHPLLFQIVPKPRIMFIGSIPGGIASSPAKIRYQQLINGQFSVGHKSAQGLGCIMLRAAQRKGIAVSPRLEENPLNEELQRIHLDARARLGMHVTNIVKCNGPTKWEAEEYELWAKAATACSAAFLAEEFRLADPDMVILLGDVVARWFSAREGWGRETLRISDWAAEAGELPCFGRKRYVTAWLHPGGNYFHIQGKAKWPLYAEQLAGYIG